MMTACPCSAVHVLGLRSALAQSLRRRSSRFEIGAAPKKIRRLAPLFPPLLDKEREQRGVFVGRSRIRFALIPNHAFHPVADRRVDHSGEDIPRPRVTGKPVTRRVRHRLLFGLRLFAVDLPLRRRGREVGLPFRRCNCVYVSRPSLKAETRSFSSVSRRTHASAAPAHAC